MSTTIAKILGSVLRSLFISLVMLLIALSVITGQFPPDFDRLQKTYTSLQELTKLSQEIHGHTKDAVAAASNAAGSMEEEDIRRLEDLNSKRAELGSQLLPHGGGEDSAPKAVTLAQSRTPEQLESKIRDLQQDLFRLQERVNRLESQNKGETP